MKPLGLLRKLAANHSVAFGMIVPNILISLGAQAYFVGYLHWTGWLSILSWVIGAGGGFEVGQLIAIKTKSRFQLGNYLISYALDEKTVMKVEPHDAADVRRGKEAPSG